MRKLLLSLTALATLGLGALTIQPAEAQPYGYGPRYHHGPAYRPYRPYRYGYRPAYAPRPYVPRCWTRMERYWNGFVWVQRPVRVCR
ncbi:hypothetical protein [Microvirga flavescens]|uniref:hypothetical protein n=1 Tax=Microvirga flavescens TaxID=2249811 RepID=UPI000DD6F942|nr:hypothetical protein [Microvirga flavescens]